MRLGISLATTQPPFISRGPGHSDPPDLTSTVQLPGGEPVELPGGEDVELPHA